MEAVACGTKGVIDSFERAGVACDRLVFSGGIVNNSLWQQVTVDVLGREVEIVVGDNLTLRACAVIGATGAGLVRNLDQGASLYAPQTQILSHDTTRQDIYRQTYEDYLALMTRSAREERPNPGQRSYEYGCVREWLWRLAPRLAPGSDLRITSRKREVRPVVASPADVRRRLPRSMSERLLGCSAGRSDSQLGRTSTVILGGHGCRRHASRRRLPRSPNQIDSANLST